MTGKLVGALLGFLFAGPFGLVMGLGIGHLYDIRQNFSFQTAHTTSPETQRVFFETLFRLLGHVAKADGQITPEEISQAEAMMTQSRLTAEHRQQAIGMFKEGAAPGFNRHAQIKAFQAQCGQNSLLRQTLVMYLIGLALADGRLDQSEREIIAEVAMALGMNRTTLEHLIRMVNAQAHFRSHSSYSGQGSYQSSSGSAPQQELNLAYEALGVGQEISDKDLKRAYRKLMSENHPDKLIGQGVPEDMVQMATERSQEIQAAYDLICKRRKSSNP